MFGTSTAAGPDNLTILCIRHLGPSGITYLTNTLTSPSPTPLSLPFGNQLLSLPSPNLTNHPHSTLLTTPSYSSHCLPFRTTVIAIDFKAFDTFPHPQLISKISSLPLNPRAVRWLVYYLKARSAKCSNNHYFCSSRPVLAGVPQGSVISPAQFNLFVSDYPSTAPLIPHTLTNSQH
ncbi:Reverse transcriptase domain [Trinorchestia longiramus]|nr:Reverse transcriptase domain [Trinorchestia longiramus]